jgi:hypothetical protein
MISPTFQRISYSTVQDKTLSSTLSSSSSVIYPSFQSPNDLIPSVCSSQSYDEICIITSDTSSSSLLYPNVTLLTSIPTNNTFSSVSTRLISRYTTFYSTSTISYSSYNLITSTISLNYTSNSTQYYDNPPLIVSIRTPVSSRFRKIFHWQYIWVILVPLLCGIILCIILAIFGFIKYQRKDVGVYEVEEAQRFRPLIVELTPSPGENNQDNIISTATTSLMTSTKTHISKKEHIKSHNKRKRKKPLLTSTNEQREFYI